MGKWVSSHIEKTLHYCYTNLLGTLEVEVTVYMQAVVVDR